MSGPGGTRRPGAGDPGAVVTCEHAGHRVPARYRQLFAGAEAVLRSHRGWDAGAADVARRLGRDLGVAPHLHFTTRLLVDLNRSLGHPRCFSEYTRGLDRTERDRIVAEHYRPHRDRVTRAIASVIEGRGRCVHLAVHTFAPVLGGRRRTADLGILYDPGRPGERDLAARWKRALRDADPELRVRRNYPYRGVDDGLTRTLRARLTPRAYAGMEIEVNQALLATTADRRRARSALRTLAIHL